MYGGTEGGPATVTRLDDAYEDRMHTSGHPHPGIELRVVSDDGQILGPGEPGIIQFRGYNPLEVIAAKDGYKPRSKIVRITAGGTVTADFALKKT